METFDNLRAAVAGVPVILFALDRDGIYTLSEGGGLAKLGRQPGAAVGHSAFVLYHDQPLALACVRKALAGESSTANITIGSLVFQAQYAPLRAADDTIVGVLGLAVDITERQIAEQALAASEAEYRLLVAAIADGVIMQTTDGSIVATNPSAERILGITFDQMRRHTPLDPHWRVVRADGSHFPIEEHPAMLALATGDPQLGVTIGVQKPDDALTWLIASAQPLVAPGTTRPYAVVSTFTDITAQRAANEALTHSEARFRALTEQSSDLVAVTDARGAVRYRSSSIDRLLGYPLDLPPTGTIFGLSHPADRAALGDYLAACLATSGPLPPLEVRLRHADGTWRQFETVATNLLDNAAIGGVVFTSRDITARKAVEAALRESETRLQQFLDQASDLIQSVDERGRFTYVNHAWSAALGYIDEEIAALSFLDVIIPDEREHYRALYDRLLATADAGAIETTFVARNGRHIAVEGRLNCRIGPGGDCSVQGIFRDVTARRELEADLTYRATHDPLTGLPNRALFLERLTGALAHASRDGSPVAVLYLDLDGFKAVNDTFGHAAGDLLLVTSAQRLRECIRTGDTAARLGGDEFAVLLEPLVSGPDADQVARRTLAALSLPHTTGGGEARVAASIGIAHSRPTDTANDLLLLADAAMYQAKSTGRARIAAATR